MFAKFGKIWLVTSTRFAANSHHAQQHWRTTVKSRNFVLALHDYYADRLSGLSTTPSETNEPPERIELADVASLGQDRWCFRYLSVRCVPDISSAIDRDASGYINISEINDFLRSIPSGWTLPQWLAFWAIGESYCLLSI